MLNEQQIKNRIAEYVEESSRNTWNGWHNDNEQVLTKINELETVLEIPEDRHTRLCRHHNYLVDNNYRRFKVVAGYEI